MLKREKFKRRILYGSAALSWVGGVGYFMAMDMMYPDNPHHRTCLVVMLTIAVTLTTTSLFTMFMAPLQAIYRNGYQDGQRVNECSAYRPDVRLAAGERAQVIPIGIRSKHPGNN